MPMARCLSGGSIDLLVNSLRAKLAKTRSSASSRPKYRMPAEWEPHAATWLAWPHERTDWPGKFAPIPWIYAEIVRHLARVERVRILVENSEQENRARRMLKKNGVALDPVQFFIVPTNRGWIRDFGPIFTKNGTGRVGVTNWRFNAWAKYDDWKKDDAVTGLLKAKLPMRVWEPVYSGRRVVLEGGSIDVNGLGILITTEECLLSPVQERNPRFTREDYEAIFRDYLGITEVLWLRRGRGGGEIHCRRAGLGGSVDSAA